MQADAVGERKVEQVGGGGGQRGIAVVHVPARGGVEGGEDIVHEVQHLAWCLIFAVACLEPSASHHGTPPTSSCLHTALLFMRWGSFSFMAIVPPIHFPMLGLRASQ